MSISTNKQLKLIGGEVKRHQPVELRNLGISLGGKEILSDCTTKINWQDRIGLVGPNGSGKTTLLNIIVRKVEPTEGEIIIKDAKIGYLPQDMTLEDKRTVWEIATDYVADVVRTLERLQTLNVLRDYDEAQKYIESHDGYVVQARIERVLEGLGLSQMRGIRAENLSGGEKMKLVLARILVSNPNFLILDEPTNHLDLKVRLWLEELLEEYNGTLLLVSHDRDLLDKVVETIWFLKNGILRVYSGDYSFFLRQSALEESQAGLEYEQLLRQRRQVIKAAQKEQQRAAHGAREARSRRPKDRDRVRLGRYKETASKTASQKQERLGGEKERVLEEIEAKKPAPKVSFRFPLTAQTEGRRGRLLAELKDVTLSYDGKPVVQNANLQVFAGQKIGLFGENGSGKTTIVRAVLGDKAVRAVGQRMVSETVRLGYLDQHTRNLDPTQSVLENVRPYLPNLPLQEIRAFLAKFLFMSNEEINQPAASLSGGEKMRLTLAQIAALNPNLLILDEPTNNLDLESLDEVIFVLSSFPGAVLVISHDLYFLRSIGVSESYLVKDGALSKLKYSPVDEEFEDELTEKM